MATPVSTLRTNADERRPKNDLIAELHSFEFGRTRFFELGSRSQPYSK
jgi:hypothetical protein